MKIIRSDKQIKRNAKIGQFAMVGGLLILAAGMFISFRAPEQYILTLGALIAGFTLSQVGIYFNNRWAKSPRPDEQIDSGLKGLDDRYYLYHYSTPVSHLLVGPCGLWVLLPKKQKGTITFSKNRYHQKGGNIYLKFFAQEGLGRPDLEIINESGKLRNSLEVNYQDNLEEIPQIFRAIVFTNPDVQLNIPKDAELPAETIHVNKLKDLIRKQTKNKVLTAEKIEKFIEMYPVD